MLAHSACSSCTVYPGIRLSNASSSRFITQKSEQVEGNTASFNLSWEETLYADTAL